MFSNSQIQRKSTNMVNSIEKLYDKIDEHKNATEQNKNLEQEISNLMYEIIREITEERHRAFIDNNKFDEEQLIMNKVDKLNKAFESLNESKFKFSINMSGKSFEGFDMHDLKLKNVDLRGTTFKNSNVSYVDFCDCLFDHPVNGLPALQIRCMGFGQTIKCTRIV